MGTSTPFKGPPSSTPLVQTWQEDTNDKPEDLSTSPPPDKRFQSARTSFTRFVRSGGDDRRNLKKALSLYVSKSTGSAKNATLRMGQSRKAAYNLIKFLRNVTDKGISDALKVFNLENLAGNPVEEIFKGLIDYICPEGGSIDEGIARDAFMETIADLSDEGITDFDSLVPDQMQSVFELYVTHTIEKRVYNDIGNKSVFLAENILSIENIEKTLTEFISRGVSDAVNSDDINFNSLSQNMVPKFVDNIYRHTFEFLEGIGEMEEENT